MSAGTRATILAVAYMLLGGLVACAVLAPQLAGAHRDIDGYQQRVAGYEANDGRIARVCTFRPDGSATCPPGSFHVDGIKK